MKCKCCKEDKNPLINIHDEYLCLTCFINLYNSHNNSLNSLDSLISLDSLDSLDYLKSLDSLDSLEILKIYVSNITKVLKTLNDLKLNISKKIKNDYEQSKQADIKISDHCIIRYFERVLNYDIEDIKTKIITNNVKYKYHELGLNSNKIEIDKDFSVLIKDNIAITILKNEKREGEDIK
jgi:hypothetical protein